MQSISSQISRAFAREETKMKVLDVMVRTPAFCSQETNIAAAVEILWNRNCGILPIVDAQKRIVGVVTDRDLAIAMGTRNRLPSEIAVNEVATGKVFSCKPDDEISAALAIMAEKRVRRLLVLNNEGKLDGILSMDDVVQHVEAKGSRKAPDVSLEDVVRTLKSVYAPQLPQVVRTASAGA
jgi:CBS domain-containing protein